MLTMLANTSDGTDDSRVSKNHLVEEIHKYGHFRCIIYVYVWYIKYPLLSYIFSASTTKKKEKEEKKKIYRSHSLKKKKARPKGLQWIIIAFDVGYFRNKRKKQILSQSRVCH